MEIKEEIIIIILAATVITTIKAEITTGTTIEDRAITIIITIAIKAEIIGITIETAIKAVVTITTETTIKAEITTGIIEVKVVIIIKAAITIRNHKRTIRKYFILKRIIFNFSEYRIVCINDNINRATILEDLSVNLWPFSCYGPDADFPNLISGDYSFEEMRWEALKEFKTKGSLVQYNQTVANMFNEAQQKKQQAIQARQSYVPPVVQQQGGNIFGGSDHGGHAPQPAITGGIFAGIDSAPQQSGGASIFGQTQGQPSIFGGAAQTQTPSIFGGGQPQQTSSIFSTPLGAAQQAPAPSPFGLGAQSPQQTAFGMTPQQGLGSTLLPQPSFQLNPGGGQGPSPFGQSLLSGQTNLFQTTPQPQTPPQQGLMPSMGLGGPGATNLSPTPISAVPASSAVSADSLTQFRADRFTFGAIPEDEPPVEVR
jgi:hypothetical protein